MNEPRESEVISVVKYKTDNGQEFYAELQPGEEWHSQLRRQVKRAQEQGNPVYEIEVRRMERDEYRRIPATVASWAFFGSETSKGGGEGRSV